MTFFTAHGGRGNEGTVQIDGMNVGAAFNGGGVSSFGYNRRTPPKCRSRSSAASVRPTVAARPSTSFPRPAATHSAAGFQSYAGELVPRQQPRYELKALHHRRAAITRTGTAASRSAARSRGSALVLRQLRTFGIISDVPGIRQQERRRPDQVELRRGSQPEGAQRQRQEDRHHPPHRSADAAQQARLLRGLSEDCTGSSYSKDGKQCRQRGDDWIALNGGFNTARPSRATCGTTARRSSRRRGRRRSPTSCCSKPGCPRSTAAGADRLRRERCSTSSRSWSSWRIPAAACRCRSTPIARRGASSATTTVSISSTTSGGPRCPTSRARTTSRSDTGRLSPREQTRNSVDVRDPELSLLRRLPDLA